MEKRGRTSREIEVKLRVEDAEEMEARLKGLGARKLGRVFEQNTLFDTPEGDVRKCGLLLRLRVETDAARSRKARKPKRGILTFKAPAPDGRRGTRYKEKLESEAVVAEPGRWPAKLKAIGLRAGFRYEKYRSSFSWPGLAKLHVCLDETPVGAFLELEGPGKEIDRAARALGYGKGEYLRSTYWDVYAADCRKRGRRPTNMVFKA
jgi:adenylate cyclase, class 2